MCSMCARLNLTSPVYGTGFCDHAVRRSSDMRTSFYSLFSPLLAHMVYHALSESYALLVESVTSDRGSRSCISLIRVASKALPERRRYVAGGAEAGPVQWAMHTNAVGVTVLRLRYLVGGQEIPIKPLCAAVFGISAIDFMCLRKFPRKGSPARVHGSPFGAWECCLSILCSHLKLGHPDKIRANCNEFVQTRTITSPILARAADSTASAEGSPIKVWHCCTLLCVVHQVRH